MIKYVIIILLPFILFVGCGHVETHKDYYAAEQVRFIQHKETLTAIAEAQAKLQRQMIDYAAAHPLVKIKNPDGYEIVVNQAMPQFNTANLEHIPMPAAAMQPREAPGEKFAMKLVDNGMFFGLGWILGDTIKSGFENAGHNTSTTTTAGGPINTVGGDVSIPTTTTTTTDTVTNTSTNIPTE